ncbi:MAG: amidohydrolase family protein, partial [Actinomycetota bacterium]
VTINMHIGSGSKMPSTSPDAPAAVGSTLTFANCCFSMVDWLMSGLFTKFTDLKIAYSEGQIGWIPYILERADTVWRENRAWGGVADKVLEPPSELFKRHVYGCFFDDPHGVRCLEEVGVDNVTYETDYPHSDSTWPHSRKIAEEQTATLTDEEVYKVLRGNAIEMLHLDHLR